MKTPGNKSFLISGIQQGALPLFNKLLFLSLTSLWLAPSATAADGVMIGKHAAHPTRILARLRQDVRAQAGPNLTGVAAPLGMELRRQYASVSGLVLLDESGAPALASAFAAGELEARRTRLLERMDRLRASGLFLYVEPDYQVQANLEPTDSAFVNGTLWGLRNLGLSGGVPGADIKATNAWEITTGSTNVVVAVIDTGINYNHLELAPQMWRNPGEIAGNGVDDDGNGYVDDVFGINAITGSGNPLDDHNHGSHCSGTIGAAANDGHPHVGVAWQVRLMACKFLSAAGSGNTSDAIECINYAVTKRAKILSNSWGGGGFSQALFDAIAAANAQNILFVAAAGNDGRNTDSSPNYPSGYEVNNVVSVAAMDRADNLASFSNFGATSVDLGAPGVAIYSTFAGANNAYGTYNGTSMACPHVAGVAALLAARYTTNITVAELRQRLFETTTPVAALNGRTVTGGRVNAFQALAIAADGALEVRVNFANGLPLRAGSTTAVYFAVTDLLPVTNATATATVEGQGPLAVRNDGLPPDAGAGDHFYSAAVVVPTNGSQLVFNYEVAAPGKTTFTGSLTASIQLPPPNDLFANRIVIPGSSNRVFAANLGASAEPGEPAHVRPAAKSVWWSWTALVAETATIDTIGSSFDTTLAIYTGTNLGSLVRVASDDDSGGGAVSRVSFPATAGVTYQIAVDGYDGESGNIVLTVFEPAPALPVILRQPADQFVLPGGDATFTVQAGGAPPLDYQWFFAGNLLSGATNDSLLVSPTGTGDVGAYQVIVAGDLGSVTSRVARLRLIEVGNGFFEDFEPAEDLTQWSSFSGEVAATNYGGSVSGANSFWFNGNVTRSAATRSLNVRQGGEVGFWLRFGTAATAPWERPDLPAEGIVVEYSVDGGANFLPLATCDTAEFFAWTRRNVSLPAAAYGPATRLRWRQLAYSGNNTDHWALDDVAVTAYPTAQPVQFLSEPESQSVATGATAVFAPVVAGTEPISFQWYRGASALPGETNLNLALPSVSTNAAGNYSLLASNALGAVTSGVAVLTVLPSLSLGEVLDAPDLTWTTGGTAQWGGQTTNTSDGVDAGESGRILHREESWLQTTLTGPGTLGFWWSVSSDSGYDFLEFRTNGVLVARISGSVNWAQRSVAVSSGVQTLRWRYTKDGSVNGGLDRGWVDQVQFVPAGPPPDLMAVAGRLSPMVSGRTLSVVSVVTNQGAGSAFGSWSDGWYWSADAVWGTNDTFLTAFSQSGPVGVDGSYTRTNTLTAPASATGAYHLIARVDCLSRLNESEEANNTLIVAVTNVPDLVPVAMELTNAAVSGKTFSVITVVTNQGAGVAGGSWADYLYLSTDAVWGTNDLQLATYTRSTAVTNGTIYRRTNTVTLPAWAGGAYHLIQRADRNNALYELSESNNDRAVAVTLTVPDLSPLAGNVSPVVTERTLSVVTTVTNRGDGAAIGSWSDGWYWSTNATWETNDTYLTAVSQTGPVGAGGGYTRTNTLTVPASAEGPQYLIVRADYLNALYESGEANNALALAVTNVPDLRPVAVELTNAAVSGKALSVITVVTNAGMGVAGGSWADYLYLSTDAVWGTNDLQLATYTWSTAVTNGAIYRRTNTVTLPAWAGGAYYLIHRADRNNTLYELADGNNDLAVAVTLTVPDLAPSAGTISPIVTGRTLSVVTTVTNRGDGAAIGSWSDGWYWSTNATWETNDTYLTAVSQTGPVGAGGGYTRTNTLTVPASAEGPQYLIVRADYLNALYESGEANNLLALAVTNVPDLRPVAVDLTNAAVSGRALTVITVVTNAGTGVAGGSWADYLYLSTDAVWGTNDLQLATYTWSTAVTNGTIYRRTNTVTLPAWAGGSYFLIHRADRNNALYELADGNNDLAVAVTLTVPDLAPSAGTISPIVTGRTLSVVTTVTNRGDGAAIGSWSDGWSWSSDATWGTNDTHLTASAQTGPVSVASGYTRTNTLTVPASAEGPQYLIVRADYLNALYESGEANNALALAVTNVPDLVPMAMELTNAAVSGKTLNVITVVTNQGAGVAAGSWADYLYLSTDAVWGTNDLQLVTYTWSTAIPNGTSYRRTNTMTLPAWAGASYFLIHRADRNNALYELADGNNDLAVPVTLTVPDLSPLAGNVSPVVTGRTLSVVTTVTNRGDGAAIGSWSDGWYWSTNATWETNDTYLTAVSQTGPVGAGGGYTRTNTLTVPAGAEGTQFLIVRADYLNALYESDEANNALALAVTNVPDLRPVVVELTNAAVSGKALSVITTVTNQGSGVAAGSWADYLYLSTDAVWGTNDLQLATYTWSTAVTNGASYRRTNTVTLPAWAGGSYFLIYRADRNNALYELTDGNNDLAAPVTLTVPDLAPVRLEWGGGQPIPGWPLTVIWSVTNIGNAAAQPTWSDVVYFSANAVLDGADTQLRSQSRSLALAVGGSYQVTNTVTIPANAPPNYYLIVKSDDLNAVFEASEVNNWRAFGVGESRDADGDGLPDWWEEQYCGSTTNCAPGADLDGDGMPNLFEYQADTNPTNALSVLRFSRIAPEASGVRLEWQGGVAARQFLERSKSLGTAGTNWVAIFTNPPPTPLQTNLFDLLDTNRTLFYRVRAVRE